MRRLVLLLVLPLTAPAWAQEPPKKGELEQKEDTSIGLSYRFNRLAGKVAVYEIENRLSQNKRVTGRSGTKDQRESGSGSAVSITRQTYEVRFERGPRGVGRVHMTPTRIYSKLIQNHRLSSEYDSDSGRPPPKEVRSLTLMLNQTATLEVTRFGDVKRVKGVKVSLREAYKRNFHKLPRRRLKVNGGWEQKKKEPIPPFGNLHYFTTFRLVEIVPRTASEKARRRIKAKILVSYEGLGPSAHSRLKITSQEGGGHLVFDEDGLLLEEKMHSEVEYRIQAVAGTEIHRVQSDTRRKLLEVKRAK